ncbi:PilW family protein [Acidovorax sp. NCPPB 4044]|uniref:PilW family protein n=1 Tax=Acidovorax sp. NCPPB 4044 TaxID=2940490 RepID=UPI0023041312|nr:PilW family protein [Acidovorax sp. NCPPB 4044]MDA8521930.1 PilW family protein [Acidovorax sp. NCPPB 4044]
MTSQRFTLPTRQRGLTLIELMVAMTISTFVALAAIAALIISRQGFTSVDAESQLRDNARFATELIQRLGVQTGYRDIQFAATVAPPNTTGLAADPDPNVFGLNNRSRTESNAWDEGTAWSSSAAGYGSDILVLRFQVAAAPWSTASSPESDKAVIDCSGNTIAAVPTDRNDRMLSILHVASGSDGDLSLMCTRSNPATGSFEARPLIRGVENFQVLYGVDGIGPGNTAAIAAASVDSVPERYLRADQLTVSGNDAATKANWRQVRSIRIGMVLRGAPGSAVDNTSRTLYPLGTAAATASGAVGSAFAVAADPGTAASGPADGRLRQTVTFTVHLRNAQVEKRG